jgi:FPC/CPF motif-containing protein YcgG
VYVDSRNFLPETAAEPVLLLREAEVRDGAPAWAQNVFNSFESMLLADDRPFPCIFGVEALKHGGLRYVFVGHDHHGLIRLRDALSEYVKCFRELGRNTSLVAFFAPPSEVEQSLAWYRERFWSILQFLHRNDHQPWPEALPQDSDHHLWEFAFDGEPMFVVCNTPAHVHRRSRFSETFMMTFQPRWVFEELTGKRGDNARRAIRNRLRPYDDVEVSPDLGEYGEPSNREWQQYFLMDENGRADGFRCPFSRAPVSVSSSDGGRNVEVEAIDRPEVLRDGEIGLAEAVLEMLPVTGSVEVQRDTPGREHPTHTHRRDEILLIVDGSIRFTLETGTWTCTSGDRLLLPKGTPHSSVAGDGGCVYLIRTIE